MPGSSGDAGRGAIVRTPREALLALVVIAALVRFGLANHSLWFDEQASAYFSRQPLNRLWSDWMLRETNPPLYYTLLKAWRAVLGSSDLAIRSLSVAASIASIPLLYRLGRRLYGTDTGIIAAGLMLVSGQQLFFAEQARAYIFVLCAVLPAIAATLALTDEGDPPPAPLRPIIVYGLSVATAIYLHTTMILFPLFLVVAAIAAGPRSILTSRTMMGRLLIANLLALAISAWALRLAVLQVLNGTGNVSWIELTTLRSIVSAALNTLFLTGAGGVAGKLFALPVLALASWAAVYNWQDRPTRFLVWLGLSSLVIMAAIGRFVPVYIPRTIFWISIVPTLLAARALVDAGRRQWTTALATALAVCLLADLVLVARTLDPEDWNTPERVLAAHPNSVLLVEGEAMALLADDVCQRQLNIDRCPYSVAAVIDTADHFDSWATYLYAGPKPTPQNVRQFVASRPVYLFRKANYHSLPPLLHRHGLGHGIPADGPPFLGPYPATALD